MINIVRCPCYRLALRLAVLVVVIWISVFLAGISEGICSSSFSRDKKKEKPVFPKSVAAGIDYLFNTTADESATFDAEKVVSFIRYVDSSAPTDKMIGLPRRDSANGAAMRMGVDAPLGRILKYTYNLDIPSYAIYPSVLRVSGWYKDSPFYTEGVKPWEYLDDCDVPKVWRGREFEVNTPDSFGGAYYRYDLNRLLILMKYEGRDVFISVSQQADKSSVGMKGLVMDDNQWNYFYS